MTISFLQSKLLLDAGFALHGFTTRAGGMSTGPYASLNLGFDVGDADENVKAAWMLLKEAIGTDLPLCRVRQVHGVLVTDATNAMLSAWDARPNIEADALVSKGDMVKAVQTADCVPLLLACTETRVTAAVHVGWRGAASGVIRNAIRTMVSLGAEPAHMIAALGPHIGYPCYEVGEEVAQKLVESADPKPKEAGTYLLDLANAVEVDLIVGGVSTDRIERLGGCTHCNEADFFSYRKSGGTCGRTAGFIA
jgi:YfiH family protein